MRSWDHGPPWRQTNDLGEPVAGRGRPGGQLPAAGERGAGLRGGVAAPAAVNSALQRARKAVEERVPPTTQQAELDALGADGQRQLVDALVAAWERADVAALLELLAEDARFTMPPLPAWFLGREDVGRFLERMLATRWRLVPVGANGQLAVACYQGEPDGDRFRLGAINVLSLRARTDRGTRRVPRPWRAPTLRVARGAMSSGSAASLNL
jgi:ketosteroid isomerase-like protein